MLMLMLAIMITIMGGVELYASLASGCNCGIAYPPSVFPVSHDPLVKFSGLSVLCKT